MATVLPADFPTGTIVANFLFLKEDRTDAELRPDTATVYGKVKFTASVSKLTFVGTTTAVTVPLVFKATIGSDGKLEADTASGVLELPATDSALLNPVGWTWKAEFDLRDVDTGEKVIVPSFSFQVPAGQTTDLAVVMPVDQSPGVITIRGPIGPDGPAGPSAYEEAIANGFVGTEAEWLASLKGPKGDPGDPGDGGVPAGGNALELLRKNSANTGAEWVAPAALPVSTATQTAVDTKVGKGELVINVRDYGAKGDYNSATKAGTDDTAAINAAAEAVFAIGPEAVLYVPYGKYKITGTVTIQCSLEASAASFFYEGTGVAVQLGSSTPGISCTRKTIKLPRVHQWTKNYNPTSHDGTSVGVKAYNLNGCDLYVPFIQWFEDGLVMYGNGAGNGYNTIYLQTLWGNHRNLVIDNDGVNGWTNQNTWIGGRLTPASWYTDDLTGTFIYCNGNSNNFIGTSMEGGSEYRHRIWIFNRYNYFYNARLEATSGGNPKIIYKAASAYNRIVGGYNMFNVEEVFESGTSGGTIQDGGDIYGKATSVAATTLTTAVPATVLWNGFLGSRITYNSGTGEFTPRAGKWRITARVAFNASGTGYRQVDLICGTTTVDTKREGGFGGSLSNPSVSGVYRFSGTETFKILATQTSGADLTLNTTNFFSNVRADYLPD